MLQYCRYCANAFDYNGEGTDFLCEADAPCGNNGAGRFYPASKAKRPNKCKQFEYQNADIFRSDNHGNYAKYHPYGKRIKLDQISFLRRKTMQVIHKPKPDPKLMTQTELYAYIHELEAENSRLEESFQKATGAVAADSLPTLAEMRKVSEMCRKTKCKQCGYFDKKEHHCRFDDGADHWNFGGADNE